MINLDIFGIPLSFGWIPTLLAILWKERKTDLISRVKHEMISRLEELNIKDLISLTLIQTANIQVSLMSVIIHFFSTSNTDIDNIQLLAIDNFKIFRDKKINTIVYSHPGVKLLSDINDKLHACENSNIEDWQTSIEGILDGVPYDFNCRDCHDTTYDMAYDLVFNLALIMGDSHQFVYIRKYLLNGDGTVKTQNSHGFHYKDGFPVIKYKEMDFKHIENKPMTNRFKIKSILSLLRNIITNYNPINLIFKHICLNRLKKLQAY